MHSLRSALFLLLLTVLAPGLRAQVRGLTYTAAPAVARMSFDDQAGFRDGTFLGGSLGFGFGEFLELSGVYLRAAGVRTDLRSLDAPASATPSLEAYSNERFTLSRYGAAIRVNAGRSALRPFARVGAGVLRFDPQERATSTTEAIYVQGGAGVAFAVANRYTLALSAARLAYRYSPYSTFGFGSDLSLQPEDFPLRTVTGTEVQAALRVYLGGRAPGQETEADRALRRQLGGEGVRVFAEPSYGVLDFNSRLGTAFPDRQPVAGVSAGLDLGPYVGLRGFYLRATDEDGPFDDPFGGFRDLALYGGELNFRFAQPITSGITPYLVAGAGYLDAGSNYGPPGTTGPPSDRYFAVAGAGVEVPLTRGLRLKAGVRSLLMSADDDGNVVLPTKVYSSGAYTAGVAFSFGAGRSAEVPEAPVAVRERAALDSLRAESTRLRAETAALQAEMRRTRDLYAALAGADSTRRDSLLALLAVERPLRASEPVRADTARRDTVRSNISNRVLQIPVPEVGEIYIRFGAAGEPVQVETAYAPPIVTTLAPGTALPGTTPPTGGLTAEQVRTLVRETIRAELAQSGAAGRALTQSDVERAVREALRTQTSRDADLNAIAQRLTAIEGRIAAPAVQRDTAMQVPPRRVSPYRFSNVMPYGGVRWGGGLTQALVGVRGEFRQADGGARFVPEVAVGFGDGAASFQAFGNYVLPITSPVEPFMPYAGAGLGLTTRSGLDGLGVALNLLAGTEYPVGPGRAFVEFSTLDFFSFNRVLAGYRFSF
jgi:hypothetical protein